jgi:hypothetical protein
MPISDDLNRAFSQDISNNTSYSNDNVVASGKGIPSEIQHAVEKTIL